MHTDRARSKRNHPLQVERNRQPPRFLIISQLQLKYVRPSENRTRDPGIVECQRQPSVPLHQARRRGIVLGWEQEDTKNIVYKGRWKVAGARMIRWDGQSRMFRKPSARDFDVERLSRNLRFRERGQLPRRVQRGVRRSEIFNLVYRQSVVS